MGQVSRLKYLIHEDFIHDPLNLPLIRAQRLLLEESQTVQGHILIFNTCQDLMFFASR